MNSHFFFIFQSLHKIDHANVTLQCKFEYQIKYRQFHQKVKFFFVFAYSTLTWTAKVGGQKPDHGLPVISFPFNSALTLSVPE